MVFLFLNLGVPAQEGVGTEGTGWLLWPGAGGEGQESQSLSDKARWAEGLGSLGTSRCTDPASSALSACHPAQGDMAVPARVPHLAQAQDTAPGSLSPGLNSAVPEQPLWAEAPLSCHLSNESSPRMSPRATASLGTAGAGLDALVISPSRASLVTPGAVAMGRGLGPQHWGQMTPPCPRAGHKALPQQGTD